MHTIDLHGLRHEDAKRKLELFINDHWGTRFKVITGHSTQMREIVEKLATLYNLDFCCDPLGSYVIIQEH